MICYDNWLSIKSIKLVELLSQISSLFLLGCGLHLWLKGLFYLLFLILIFLILIFHLHLLILLDVELQILLADFHTYNFFSNNL